MNYQNNQRMNPVTFLIAGALVVVLLLMFQPWDGSDTLQRGGEPGMGNSDEDREPYSQGIMEADLDFTVDEFINTARDLEGAPYQSGGKDPEEGFNSSGFVQYVYEEATGIRMPRIAGHQYELGESISKSYLQKGDVVFFEGNTIMSGIYTGDGHFMTATESSGITTLHLENDSFWADNYIGAKRLTDKEIEALHPSTYKDHDHPTVQEAMNYLGTPYEFGGSSLEAFDCSYFVQDVFRESIDVYLPRVTLDQYKVGEDISEDDLQPGDVIYFSDVDIENSDREEGEVTHAGIYTGENFMIHASRTEQMTQISYLNDYWKDALTGIKRFDGMSLNGESPIVQEAAVHLTTPYQKGGSHPGEGFNPIGFVRYVYEKSEGTTLPSSAKSIWNNGTEVDSNSLQAGDILFFEGNYNLLPAIYAGNDQFFIASQSSGVTTRHLEHSEYFSERFAGARRY
ncbi:C40 family peptidase [Salipaludibacillus aurantiacus]|uniref:Cell wall-associated hydrolase, NlpC family n=1 Tax=Salipaludibacillus aurantiacus TaxID=1601833 RepID=A0A1H9XAE2_9BACI|nr:C40 family peptidase [Salipaludibacillus aurantiacus]SES43178.1 Cell wall-associated hydrolase, NlpC family [Salipaludibacillus aurantiacus]